MRISVGKVARLRWLVEDQIQILWRESDGRDLEVED